MSVEIARFAWTCRFARDAMKAYAESWGIRLKAIASKHKMIISRDTTNKKNMKDPDRFYITDVSYFYISISSEFCALNSYLKITNI